MLNSADTMHAYMLKESSSVNKYIYLLKNTSKAQATYRNDKIHCVKLKHSEPKGSNSHYLIAGFNVKDCPMARGHQFTMPGHHLKILSVGACTSKLVPCDSQWSFNVLHSITLGLKKVKAQKICGCV